MDKHTYQAQYPNHHHHHLSRTAFKPHPSLRVAISVCTGGWRPWRLHAAERRQPDVAGIVDSGAACHAWPCKTKSGSSRGGTFLTATGAPVASQGTLDVSFQLVDVHSVAITVKAIFELLLVRRPILSVSRLVDKGFADVMGKEQGNTLGKDGRVTHLHKSNGVYHVRATALSELCPLEDQDPRNDDAPPAGAVGEAIVPWTRRLPYKPTEDERLAPSVSHLPFKAWCSHCVKGLARDWPHRSDYGPPPDVPVVAMDFCFVNTVFDDDVLTILAMKENPFQSVGATVLLDKSASEFAVATISGYLDFWGHQEVMIKCDQEQSMNRIAGVASGTEKTETHDCSVQSKGEPSVQRSSGKRTLPLGRTVENHAL